MGAIGSGGWFLAKLFEGLVSITALGLFNKIAGAIFGVLKYAFLVGLFLYFFNKADAALILHPYNSSAKLDLRLY